MKRIAVFGYSLMAVTVMARLREAGYPLLGVVGTEAEAELFQAQGFASQVVDFRNDDALRALGIGSDLAIVFCFFPSDSDNVFLTISARALAADLTIIAVVDDPESADKLLAAGADKIIDPHEICGRKAHEMLVRADISTILDHTVFGQHDLNIAQIEIPPGSPYLGGDLETLGLDQPHSVLLLGMADPTGKGLQLAVDGQTRALQAGDVLVVMGSAAAIKAFGLAVAVPRC